MPKLPIGSMAQYVMKNPFTTAAAVFAPIFAQNEDRGFFRTALITTPIIFAAGTTVPRLFAGVRDFGGAIFETRDLLQKAEKWSRYEQPNFNSISNLFKDPAIPGNLQDRALSAYLVTEKRSRDFLREQKSLSRLFNRSFVKTSDLLGKSALEGEAGERALAKIAEITQLHETKGRLITNALHVARRSSLTPVEWSQEPSGVAADIPLEQINEWLTSTFNQYQNRPEFVSTLRNRLREVKSLNYLPIIETASLAPGPSTTVQASMELGGPVVDALRDLSPNVYEGLQKAIQSRYVQDVTVVAEKVTTGEVGRILNVTVIRKGNLKPLQIPIVDPTTGSVRLGSNAIGVGNYVIGPDLEAKRIDEWITKQLAENPQLTNEQLEEEIAAHAYWFAGDPMDAHRMSELAAMGAGGESTLSAQAIKLRSFGAGVTKLPIFRDNVSYEQFSAGEKVDWILKLMNTNRFIGMGSEAGIYEGRWQLRDVENLSPFGAPSSEKQDPIWRSVTKEFRLSAPEGLPAEARMGWKSTAWEELTGSEELPGAKFTVAGISPQDRTLFSELPESIDKLQAGREDIIQKFVNRGLSQEQAMSMFEEVEDLYKQGNQKALSYLGGMGETGFVVNPDFANNFQVEGISKYNVDELAVKAGDVVDANDVIGFNKGERVLPKFTGQVVSTAQGDEGFVANIRHELPIQGAKLDIAGVKGMARVPEDAGQFDRLRDLMNSLYKKLGEGDEIPSTVNVLTPAEYFTNKIEPTHAYLGIGSDLVSRLHNAGAYDVTKTYLEEMESEGATFFNNQFVIDASKNPTKDIDKARKLRRVAEINEDFFFSAGEVIQNTEGYNDPVLTAYVNSDKELGDFMLKNQLPVTGFAWDHSRVNIPRFATISPDVETYMALGGNYRALKAMKSRLKTVSGGDPRQALDFAKFVMQGDFSKPLGEVVSANEAFSASGSLTQAYNRAGSIVDPSIDKYRKNFSLDLGDGKFIPVPGTEAYGAEAPQYAPGEYQKHDWQVTLQKLTSEKDPVKRDELQEKLIEEYKLHFATGKGTSLRPYQYDPLGVPGFLSTAAEQEDPFVAKVSKDWVERVHSKRLRQALLKGEDVAGMIQRQPTNELLFLKYRLDPTLAGTYDVAVPESISRALMGDQDKDLINNILFDANIRMQDGKLTVASAANKIEREAAEEAIEAMEGKQIRQLQIWQEVKGVDEIARLNTDFKLSSLEDRSEKFAKSVANRIGIASNRTAGAAIGTYSNLLTKMVIGMERNPEMRRDPELTQRLKTALFDIRQAPISARKSHVAFNLEVAMKKRDLLAKAIENQNPEQSATDVHKVLLGMAETLTSKGKEGPEYGYLSTQGLEDLKVWAKGRTEESRLLGEAFTTNVDRTGAVPSRVMERLESIFKTGIEDVLGPVHGGRMATESASRLGSVVDYISSAGRDIGASTYTKVAAALEKNKSPFLLGLGTIAALGIAMTPRVASVASFSGQSGNRFRPERNIGVGDTIPSESVPGSMSPSSPPRRVEQAQPGVRTAVVAPMRQTSDLYVKMKATDRSRASDTAKLISQIPQTGDTNVTINYRDRTKLRSLRTRERIRELR